MQLWICLILTWVLGGIIIGSYETTNLDYYIKNKRNYTIIWSKETLLDIVEHNKVKIINKVVNEIVGEVLYNAKNTKKMYEWKEVEHVLDDNMFDIVIKKLQKIFPDTKLSYITPNEIKNINYDNIFNKINYYSSINLDWSSPDTVK
jgi:hypothetical protein